MPNPVASATAGTSATLYYVIVADDDDDSMGNCDHTTQSQVYSMVVTAGGTTTAGLCQACTADSQCGTGNECVYVGSMGDSYCLQACGAGCPTGYSCSAATIYSVDGARRTSASRRAARARRRPASARTTRGKTNDDRSAASHNPTMAPDLYDLVQLPDDDRATRG